MNTRARMRIGPAPIDVAALRAELFDPQCGGYCAFEGWVRDHNAGAPVAGLDYEAYADLVLAQGEAILAEALARFDIVDARCVHRTGALEIGEVAIFIGVSARHRDAAFRACRYIIDEAKHRLPVWKKERYLDREPGWVDASHEHGHDAGAWQEPPNHPLPAAAVASAAPGRRAEAVATAPAGNLAPASFQPDYSRQTVLAGIGAEGQARLAASRVLVIGAGGLGAPVLAYLAGAGVGTLGLVDPDRVEASNLHRQPLFAAADVGQWKVDVAARQLRALNPAVDVEVVRGRLDAAAIDEVFARYDLVLECTDSIASKYLSSDAAVRTGTPIVFASIYQYEGQLHAYAPEGRSPCLRCLWPQPPDPASIGTCVQGGVLGPVPGVLGAMQAMEALKRLLGLPGVVDEHLLLVNLLDHGIQRIAATRCPPCRQAGHCVRLPAQDQERVAMMLEQAFPSLDAALADGWQLVDIRNADELDAQPMGAPGRWIPMQRFLAGPVELGDGKHLIVCAHGQRSLYIANLLRQQGQAGAVSLQGGLAGLRG
jgi:molybdopterin/thiamine biosynthesis adenylyltransferase/molybdopterin synthase catalytic subunit/rhodanese-related sulfurtransferase